MACCTRSQPPTLFLSQDPILPTPGSLLTHYLWLFATNCYLLLFMELHKMFGPSYNRFYNRFGQLLLHCLLMRIAPHLTHLHKDSLISYRLKYLSNL